jgi:hypothetical protein
MYGSALVIRNFAIELSIVSGDMKKPFARKGWRVRRQLLPARHPSGPSCRGAGRIREAMERIRQTISGVCGDMACAVKQRPGR